MRVCGVDDAGRGPVIGPLVIAGVLIRDSKVDTLKSLGVRDSKQLSRTRRSELALEIPRFVDQYHLVELQVEELDRVVNRMPKFQRLNQLEAHKMAEVIEKLKPDVAYVDSSDVDTERYRNDILDRLSFKPKVVSEHYADSTYPVVSAASILAKVQRDSRIDEIKKEFGDFGSGYAHDERTRKFLEDYYKANRDFPPCVRRSWATLKQIDQQVFQSRL